MASLVALHTPAVGIVDAGGDPIPPVDVLDSGAAASPPFDALNAVGPFDPSALILAAVAGGLPLVALEA